MILRVDRTVGIRMCLNALFFFIVIIIIYALLLSRYNGIRHSELSAGRYRPNVIIIEMRYKKKIKLYDVLQSTL